MQAQGCLKPKVKNQSFTDSAKTKVKKRVLKCPCSGVYKPCAKSADGVRRQTTTQKSDCGVYINLNVGSLTGECAVACFQRCAAELTHAYDLHVCGLQLKPMSPLLVIYIIMHWLNWTYKLLLSSKN